MIGGFAPDCIEGPDLKALAPTIVHLLADIMKARYLGKYSHPWLIADYSAILTYMFPCAISLKPSNFKYRWSFGITGNIWKT